MRTSLLSSPKILLFLSLIAILGFVASLTAESDETIASSFSYPIENPTRKIGYNIQNEDLGGWKECFQADWSKLWHAGEDWFAPAGTQVKAVANGVVKYVHPIHLDYPGSVVIIEHTIYDGTKIYSMYGHLSEPPPVVVDDEVKKGDTIGNILYQPNNTHLHWEIRNFLDGSFICNNGSIPAPGYTYPNRPDSFPNNPDKRYYSPSDFIENYSAGKVSASLIIDSTGSMDWNDPNGLRKDAAKVFINSASIGDGIAVVDFDTNAVPHAPLTIIQTQEDKYVLEDAVDLIDSYGGTDLNSGLNAGYSELFSDVSSNEKFAIFLTDGEQDTNPPSDYDPQSHLQFQQQGWPIYTFGLGLDTDEALLGEIASETNGQYFSLNDANQLATLYFELSQRITDGESILETSTLMTQGDTKNFKTNFPLNPSSVTFFISWPGSEVSMGLISPSGKVICPWVSEWDKYHAKGLTYELYTIQLPEVGEWTIELFGDSLPPRGEDVEVRVAVQGMFTTYLPVVCKDCAGSFFSTNVVASPRVPKPTSLMTGNGSFICVNAPTPTPTSTPPIEPPTLTPTPTWPSTATSTPTPSLTPTISPTFTPTSTPTVMPSGSVEVYGVLTADGSWNPKNSFVPGDSIQWIIEVENTTGADADVELIYDIRDPNGAQIVYWTGQITTPPGLIWWGLPGTIGRDVKGTYTLKGIGNHQGNTSQATTSYLVENISIGMIKATSSENTPPIYPYNRLIGLGYEVTFLETTADVNDFRQYDIVYLPVGWAEAYFSDDYSVIESNAGDYKTYVNEGGGLFVDQPNPFTQPGDSVTPTVLPYTITFYNPYDQADWPPIIVNPDHFITHGLPRDEMPGPSDQITAIDSAYAVLVRGQATNSPSLVVAEYGQGRILVQTAHPSYSGFSDEVYHRMVEWVSSKAGATYAGSNATSKDVSLISRVKP